MMFLSGHHLLSVYHIKRYVPGSKHMDHFIIKCRFILPYIPVMLFFQHHLILFYNHSLTAPDTMPPTIYFCMKMNRMMMGVTHMTSAAIMRP